MLLKQNVNIDFTDFSNRAQTLSLKLMQIGSDVRFLLVPCIRVYLSTPLKGSSEKFQDHCTALYM